MQILCSENILFQGEPAGTLVIADHALNAGLKATYNHYVLGELRSWPTNLNAAVVNELAQLAKEMGLTYAIGATVATEDFYQGFLWQRKF